jgi:inner membrane protein
VLFRWLGTASLVLLLQIPIGLIAGTIQERRSTQGEALSEVTRTWGGSQQLIGPVLTIPYLERWLDKDRQPQQRRHVLRVLPRGLKVTGKLQTEVRRRGIFDVPLFTAGLHVSGLFALPDASRFPVTSGDIEWGGAQLHFGISDAKAIRSCSPLSLGSQSRAFEPGSLDESLAGGLHASVPPLTPGTSLPFSFDLELGGSGRFSVVPAGDETVITLSSPWPDPSFDGAWLPADRRVTAEGFEATWKILALARNFPSAWQDSEVRAETLRASTVGVTLLSPVDTYRTNERAVKYQLLFLGLTFLGFALFELLARLRVHPLQYLLVGLALCVFYLLLLSLSEQLGFGPAYGIAAAAIVGLITLYLRAVLGTFPRALGAGAGLSVLYGFLFVLLRIQEQALLFGSVGLFAALALVMWVTRRIDWYAEGERTIELAG